jgi:hypothetical protein
MPHSLARRLAWISAARAVGRRWRSYLALLGIAAAAVIALAVVPNLSLRPDFSGITLAAVAVLVVLSIVGSKTPRQDGRLAEQWTLDGLRKLRGWHITDHVPFDRESVDHIVVAPAGVLAVETKYRTRTADSTDSTGSERHQRDLGSADRAAHKVRLLLRAEQLRDAAVVIPVLMVRGPGAPNLPDGHRLENGVRIVDGNHPERWLHLFNEPRLAPGLRRELHARFDRFAVKPPQPAAVPVVALPPLRRELWREFRAGIAAERDQRRTRKQPDDRHRVPAPTAAVVPTATPVAAGASPAGRFAP